MDDQQRVLARNPQTGVRAISGAAKADLEHSNMVQAA
jgi:hypothetical protein